MGAVDRTTRPATGVRVTSLSQMIWLGRHGLGALTLAVVLRMILGFTPVRGVHSNSLNKWPIFLIFLFRLHRVAPKNAPSKRT